MTHRGAGEYRRYALEVPNRSLVDPDARRSMANLLQAVLDAVDPDTGGDVQLIDVHVNGTADPDVAPLPSPSSSPSSS
jgi:hypothetical protein